MRDVAEVQALDVEYVLHRCRVRRICASEPAHQVARYILPQMLDSTT